MRTLVDIPSLWGETLARILQRAPCMRAAHPWPSQGGGHSQTGHAERGNGEAVPMTIKRTREVLLAIGKVLGARKAYQAKLDPLGRPVLLVYVDGETWWVQATQMLGKAKP